MINIGQMIKMIVLDNNFIKNIYIGEELVYRQNIDDVKLLSLDKFLLEKLDGIKLG